MLAVLLLLLEVGRKGKEKILDPAAAGTELGDGVEGAVLVVAGGPGDRVLEAERCEKVWERLEVGRMGSGGMSSGW